MSLKNLYAWQDNSITTLAESLWGEYYNTIASCNALLERVDNITLENASEEKDKAAIISEAKALKALCYFNLLLRFCIYQEMLETDFVDFVNSAFVTITQISRSRERFEKKLDRQNAGFVPLVMIQSRPLSANDT